MRIFLILFVLLFSLNSVEAGITYYNNNNSVSNTKTTQSNDAYKEDLNMVEKGIFGRIYPTDNVKTRITRIERRMFNRVYPSMSISQRMNNIVENYENGTAYNNSLKNRLINTFIGQPTGYTPPVYPSPYINTYGPSYMQGTYGNNGWGYHNIVRPVMTGAGIHILD
ncbi:hypothetical protein IJ579_02535 [bacterium]|nr:hypothetical protein [bacterium]